MSWPKKIKGAAKNNAAKTHCKHGHEFTPENTIWKDAPTAGGKMRVCRKCKVRRDTARRRKRGQQPQPPRKWIRLRVTELDAILAEHELMRKTLETIAGTASDRLQATQARGALANIGPAVTNGEKK